MYSSQNLESLNKTLHNIFSAVLGWRTPSYGNAFSSDVSLHTNEHRQTSQQASCASDQEIKKKVFEETV